MADLNHQTDTPASFSSVPGHTRLFRREPGGTYYLRAKVPLPIRPIVGKTEIRVSLKTKDLKEGRLRVKPESMRVDRLFAEAEAKLKGETPRAPIERSLEELRLITSDWFIKEEARAARWAASELPRLDELEKDNLVDILKTDNAVLNGCPEYSPIDGNQYLDDFLNEDGRHLGIQKGSEDYNLILPLFRQAKAENLARLIDLILGNRPKRYDKDFSDLHAFTPLLPSPSSPAPVPAASPSSSHQTLAFGKFLDDFMDYQREVHTETTPLAYAMPIRVLRETIGEETPLHSITRQDLEKACETLRRIPVNMVQRYRGLSIEKAIEAARRAKDTRTLGERTLSNYYILILAVFNYACDEGLIAQNPAKSRKLSEIFKPKGKKVQRALFTPTELTSIFMAPLFTGCRDDDTGFAIPGERKPRRGRFWVPLLGLFNGLRLNEACQLYVEDVGKENNIPFLHIRGDLDEEKQTEKRVKNVASWRKVPIHPELLKIGFMDYVAECRRDKSSPRLFPTLENSITTGRYSKVFSKWFGRFLELACGQKPKATFHSFRHHFRTALIAGNVQTELAEALGGWKAEGSSETEYRHGELPMLRGAIEKIAYPGLDLSHLHSH